MFCVHFFGRCVFVETVLTINPRLVDLLSGSRILVFSLVFCLLQFPRGFGWGCVSFRGIPRVTP